MPATIQHVVDTGVRSIACQRAGRPPPSAPVTIPSSDGIAPVMSLRGVTVSFSGKVAVRDVSFDVPVKQVISLIGPSGSGKTTILRALNRMHDLS